MKKDIHPENYRLVVFKDMSNDYMFLTKSCANTEDTVELIGGFQILSGFNSTTEFQNINLSVLHKTLNAGVCTLKDLPGVRVDLPGVSVRAQGGASSRLRHASLLLKQQQQQQQQQQSER